MRNLDQVGLVEQGHLQLPIAGEFLDLVGAQCRDPLDAIVGRNGTPVGIGEQAEHDLRFTG